MREIKFRAWHTQHQEMYHVHMFYLDSKTVILKCYDGVDKLWKDRIFAASVERLDLMQYTGRNDKHGQHVFEGDIIHRPDVKIPMLVRWNEKNAGFDLTMRDLKNFDSVVVWYSHASHTDYEIIGNIYENPKLLKVNL